MVAFVQSVSNNSGSATPVVAAVLGVAPTPGNLLVVFATGFQNFSAINAAFTDSGVSVVDANTGTTRLLYRYVQPGDVAALAIATCNSNFWDVAVHEISGISGAWIADFVGSITGTSAANPFTTTGIVSVNANDFAIGYVEAPQGASPAGAFDVAWTQREANTGGGYGYVSADRQVPVAATNVQATITYVHAFTAAYIVVLFKDNLGATDLQLAQGVAKFGIADDPADLRLAQGVAKLGITSGVTADLRLAQGVIKYAVRVGRLILIPENVPPTLTTQARAPYIKQS